MTTIVTAATERGITSVEIRRGARYVIASGSGYWLFVLLKAWVKLWTGR